MHPPSQPVGKEGCTSQLFSSEIVWIVQAGIPETIFPLNRDQRLTHFLKSLLVLLAVRSIFGHHFQNAYKGRQHPAIASRPVTIFAIGFLVRCYKILVAPPQIILWIVKSNSALNGLA